MSDTKSDTNQTESNANVEAARFAFVFSGGGAYCVPELGFAHYAVENNFYSPDSTIVGTSFGAITAATMAFGFTQNQIFEMISDFDNLSQNAFNVGPLIFKAFTFIYKWGLVDLTDTLAHYFGGRAFPKNLTTCATQLETLRPNYWTYKDDISVLQAVASSASIPMVFSPVKFKGFHYVDGGIVENTPATAAIGNLDTHIIITGSYPSAEYDAQIENFTDYIQAMIQGPINFLNYDYTRQIPNAHLISLKSNAKNSLDFSQWSSDYKYGYDQAKEFFSQPDIINLFQIKQGDK